MRYIYIGRTIAFSFALLVALGGCRDERDPILPPGPDAAGREYFPLAVGQFWEYDVEEHHWDLNVDSVARFQFRERVDTVFQGATGELNYRIVRSRRADSTSVWLDDSATAVVLSSALVRRTTANVPTIELLFPVADGKGWNPNLFNSADSTRRSYARVGSEMTLANGQHFPRTVQVADEPLINAVKHHEVEAAYAWDIGCVYRHRKRLEFCNTDEVSQGLCQLGSNFIVRGSEREEQLRAWGPR